MNPWRWFGLAAVFVITVWLISWALITWQLGNPKEPGLFGDMFGAANALFSGLAFAGVIVAILMQRDELRLQREEIRLQRKELARSALAQEAQAEILRITAVLNARAAVAQARGVMSHEFDANLKAIAETVEKLERENQ